MNWKGKLGFLKGGYYASKSKDVQIEISEKINDYDELVVVSPLWAGTVVPAVKVFLKSVPNNKVNLVVTSISTTIKNRSEYKTVSDIILSKNNEKEIIDNLVNSLLK